MSVDKEERILDDRCLEDLESAVFSALGAASVCWDSMENTGVFHSDRASQIGDELIEYIKENYEKKEP